MLIPKDEIPNLEQIRELAAFGLPSHYRLKSVRCTYGSEWPDFLPEDFEIVIEYENHLDNSLKRTFCEIEAHQKWAHALVQDIRGDWPDESIRITFSEKEPENGHRGFK